MHLIKAFSFNLGKIVSFIRIGLLINLGRKFYNYFYSGFLVAGFRKHGKSLNIHFPSYIQGGKYISLGDNFVSFERLRMEAIDYHNGIVYTPEIIVGNNVSFNFDCHVGIINQLKIGNNVLIGSRVFITDHFHGATTNDDLKMVPNERRLFSKGPVIIKDNVWIGEGVCIMPGVVLGENCIVGSNSVVTKSFPPYSIIGGVPAKIIKIIDE